MLENKPNIVLESSKHFKQNNGLNFILTWNNIFLLFLGTNESLTQIYDLLEDLHNRLVFFF